MKFDIKYRAVEPLGDSNLVKVTGIKEVLADKIYMVYLRSDEFKYLDYSIGSSPEPGASGIIIYFESDDGGPYGERKPMKWCRLIIGFDGFDDRSRTWRTFVTPTKHSYEILIIEDTFMSGINANDIEYTEEVLTTFEWRK